MNKKINDYSNTLTNLSSIIKINNERQDIDFIIKLLDSFIEASSALSSLLKEKQKHNLK